MGRAEGKQHAVGAGRRQRDTTGSKFYCARTLSPDETFKVIDTAFAEAVVRVRDAYRGAALEMTDGRLTSFHRLIFGGLFAEFEGAGRYRHANEPTQFRVPEMRDGQWKMRTVHGAPPQDVASELVVLFDEWNSWRASSASERGPSPSETCLSISKLYTGVLRVHPFVDGNHRAGFVALSAALTSVGLPLIAFRADVHLLAHDRTVGAAIIPEQRDPLPFAGLLEERLSTAKQ